MKIKPNRSFHLLGTDIEVDKNKVYEVEFATNIPHWEITGAVFVNGLLLSKEDYEVVEKSIN